MAGVASGRDAGRRAHILGEALRPLQLRRLLIGAKHGNAGVTQAVAQTADQRCLRPDYGQADSVPSAERDNSRVVGDVEIYQFSLLRDPGIARRRKECIAIWRLRELPRQRMFATARTNEQDIHVRK